VELDFDDVHALRELSAYLRGGETADFSSFLLSIFRHQQTTVVQRKTPSRTQPPDHTPLEPVKADPKSFPPWGLLSDDQVFTVLECIIPVDWKPKSGDEPSTKTNWWPWVITLINGIDKSLYPRYYGGTCGAVDVGLLLDADFTLLRDLRDYHLLPIKSMYPTPVMHRDMFLEEDDDAIDFATRYERYDPTLPAHVLKGLPDMLSGGIADKVGTLDLLLKAVFQRPRAYQIALIQKRWEVFTYAWARSGNSPSLVSGHTLQATLGVCSAYVALEPRVLGANPASTEVLKQFMVDIGDRRVFEGVHYPSDNLASWYVAFRLLKRVFGQDEARKAREFLWDAMLYKSPVFQAIDAHSQHDGSPYRAMVEKVRRLAAGEDIDEDDSEWSCRHQQSV
jgi:hypothetical protein